MPGKHISDVELFDEESSSDESTRFRTDSSLTSSINITEEIFNELNSRQINDVPYEWKLTLSDIKRICKYIDTSIFDNERCCIWKGYVTNVNNSTKGLYVNFFFKKKKVALHRLLYSNYVAPLNDNEYLKFKCENKGTCCNVNHYEKYRYSRHDDNGERTQRRIQKKDESVSILLCNIVVDFD